MIVVLYGLAALGETWKPRLGLDLEGGTRITLSAIEQGGAVTPTKLKQAASIVDRRVNGSGVSEAEVSTQGNRNIIVEIPGKNASNLVDAVKRTAQLRFRLVAGLAPARHPGRAASRPRPRQPVRPSPVGQGQPRQARRPRRRRRPSPGHPQAAAGTLRRPHPHAHAAPATPAALGRGARRSSDAAAGQRQKGAPVDHPLAWSQDPGVEWLTKFAKFTCPTASDDNADRRPARRAADHLRRQGPEVPALRSRSSRAPSSSPPPTAPRQNGVGWAVNLGFKSTARKVFGDTTTALNKNSGTFAIVLDGKVISYAGVNEPILDGNAQITGDFKESEARSLANSLKYGALPLKFDTTIETIGPSLAGNQLSAGVAGRHRRPADRDALLPALLPRPGAGGGRLADRRGADHLRASCSCSATPPASRSRCPASPG